MLYSPSSEPSPAAASGLPAQPRHLGEGLDATPPRLSSLAAPPRPALASSRAVSRCHSARIAVARHRYKLDKKTNGREGRERKREKEGNKEKKKKKRKETKRKREKRKNVNRKKK
jgi:hypothetical protein